MPVTIFFICMCVLLGFENLTNPISATVLCFYPTFVPFMYLVCIDGYE